MLYAAVRTADDPVSIQVAGLYTPRDYQSKSKRKRYIFPLTNYIEHLHAETHAARIECTTLAAALGGLFVTGLQEVLGQFNYGGLTLDGGWVPVLFNSLVATVLILTLLSGVHYFFRSNYSYNES